MENNYRIHTNILSDTVLNVNMKQDYDFLELLTLKLRQKDAYRLHSSNYGVIIGRVLANDAFGIPNARISVFIERDTNDPTYMESIYPFTELTDRDKEGRRYNLLPSDSNDDCYRIVGTFPSKRLVLDDNVQLEVFDKYYKFSTVTNNAGDYMLFGIPSGNQQIHVDIDLSDIGILSQTPRDFEYKGYSMTMFDSPTQFKESTNIDNLAQIYSQNNSVFVYPFWGDEDLGNGVAAITRADIQIQYKFEPTCVFMGAIISDNEANAIGHKCSPAEDNGMNSQLIAGEGTIEMIRRTPDGLVEEYSIQGNQLIDANGVWCYQIPMNLDFVGTDEYGNIVPTDNPSKGIPTRTQVRFRFSKNETGNEGHSRYTAKYLVPMNPTLINTIPQTLEDGKYIEKMYEFGSNTPDDCFRDLYWNNVYSVKNYIPKTQVAHRPHAPNYTGLKGSNLVDDQNPVPFNKLRIDIPFMYAIVCIIFSILIIIVTIINVIMSILHYLIYEFCFEIPIIGVDICPFGPLGWVFKAIGVDFTCISLGAGLSDDNTAFYPGCSDGAMEDSSCPSDMDNCTKRASTSALIDLVQQKLASDYKIVKLDFYQDWLNGSLYMPLWYWKKSKKKTFLFWTISDAENEFCDCDRRYSRLKTYLTCSFWYKDRKLGLDRSRVPEGEDDWHRKSRAERKYFPNGLIKGVKNKDGLTAYYYVAIQPTDDAVESVDGKGIKEMGPGFEAIRLFATDIILLGNLNEDNLYGIPQFFKALPSTTANIPPIATIHDSNDEEDTKESKNTLADSGDTSGPSMTTGMDWVGGGGTPRYSEGLFMDLACTYADTKAKSCINVERLSELGMSLDMQYEAAYPTASGLKVGTFYTDGMISKYELDDIENRAMFATMNHVGFVPQTYQDKHSGFTTQVQDENTTYYVPKFKYLYPTDLDGRMSVIMDEYWNGFKQVASDDTDESYINFRLGDTQYSASNETKDGIIQINRGIHDGNGQFYLKENDDRYSLPLYNNSFYFYFGVKKGNTAIEKFNKMFYSKCFKNSKYPFSYDLDKQGLSYCISAYSSTTSGNAISYISFTSDDIETPYSYTLIDSLGRDKTPSGNTDIETNTIIISENNEGKYLENGYYILKITDNNGKSLSERVSLDMPYISASVNTRGLGRKYYDGTNDSEIICDNDYFGLIEISDVFIDSYRFDITRILCPIVDQDVPIGSIGVKIFGVNNDNMFDTNYTHIANLYLQVMDENGEVGENTRDYLCTDPYYDGNNKKLVFKIYRPATFLITMKQMCNGGELSSNTSVQSVIIENGENFNAYLNEMPIKFMMDNGNKFYPPITEGTQSQNWSNWVEVNNPSSYVFPVVNEANKRVWEDYVDITNDINDLYNRKNILLYKFEKIFNLCKSVYVVGNGGDNTFKYTATGGIQPTLYRSLAPYYSDDEMATTTVNFSERNGISVNAAYPNIVGSNYSDTVNNVSESPRINRKYAARNRNNIGNYFCAFSNNGRYTDDSHVDCDKYCEAIPTSGAVNVGHYTKILGEDNEFNYIPDAVYKNSKDEICHAQSKPYFKAMFVDRRLDCDLTILSSLPQTDEWLSGHSIYHNTETGQTIIDTRVGGYFYNGIEMAYDENYNIIGERESNGLEYYYNINDTSLSLNTNPNIHKRYYSATICGENIIDAFWSSNHVATRSDGANYDLISHDISQLGVNGFFNKNNYPTKRYIDIYHINPHGIKFNLSVKSCSYPTKLKYDGDDEISSKLISTVSQGEKLEIDIKFGTGIAPTLVTSKTLPKFGKQEVDYGHFIFKLENLDVVNKSNDITFNNVNFTNVGFMVDFKNTMNNNFETYITVPKFITLEQIKTLKSKGTISEIDEFWNNELKHRFKSCVIDDEHHNNLNNGHEVKIWNEINPTIYYKDQPLSVNKGLSSLFVSCGGDIEICPNDSSVDEFIATNPDYGYIRQDVDSSLSYSTFSEDTNDASEIALCYKRICNQLEKTNLQRRITTYEFTDFYYCGKVNITIRTTKSSREAIINTFYVTKEDGSTPLEGEITVNYILKWNDEGSAFVVTWNLGTPMNLDDLGFDNSYHFDSIFCIYLTTYDGIRYKFQFSWELS